MKDDLCFSEQTAALVAAAGSLLSFLLVLIFVPSIPKQRPESSEAKSVFNLAEILKVVTAPGATSVLVIRLFCGVPIGVFQSMFSVIAIEKFGLPAEKNGMMLSYIGVVSIFMQGVGIGLATKFVSESKLMILSTAVLTVAYFVLVSTFYRKTKKG